MVARVWSNPRSWRTFADGVALALGVNVWISVVVLPSLFVGSLDSSAQIAGALLPLGVLGLGLFFRSEAVLLLGFPSALLVPVAIEPEIVSAHVYGPIRFSIVAAGLIAYLLGVSFFTSWYEPPPPESVRPLASSRRPIPPRWKRRFRVYRYFVALSVVFPVTMIYLVNFHEPNQTLMLVAYPGRATAMTAMLNVLVIAAWLGLYLHAFLGALRPHRTGDRNLVADLGRLESEARRGRPRPIFYVGVVCALGFMALLLSMRYM